MKYKDGTEFEEGKVYMNCHSCGRREYWCTLCEACFNHPQLPGWVIEARTDPHMLCPGCAANARVAELEADCAAKGDSFCAACVEVTHNRRITGLHNVFVGLAVALALKPLDDSELWWDMDTLLCMLTGARFKTSRGAVESNYYRIVAAVKAVDEGNEKIKRL